MHQTTYGYNIIDTGDPSKTTSGWFAGLNSNWSRIDGHTHDGINSAPLSITSFPPLSTTIAHASWITSDRADGGSMITIATPAGIDDCASYNVFFEFTAPSGMVGQRGILDWVRLGATSLKVYCNDNTADFTVLFR